MSIRRFFHRAGLAVALLAASFWIVPSAFAHSHVRLGIGISAPGFGVSAGNCWRCGYLAPPPVYYVPAYPPPVYYYPAPTTVYYVPRPAYYGYGYYAPRYHHYRGGYYRDRGWRHRRGGYYHHRHR